MEADPPDLPEREAIPLFVRQYRRVQLMIGVLGIALLIAALTRPIAMFAIWAVGLPIIGYAMWRLRCWHCHRRLLGNGGTEIEWAKKGWFLSVPARHKSCGARLI